METLTFHNGKTFSTKHNTDKDFRARQEHIDAERTKDNIILKNETVKEAYEKLFNDSLEKYNNKQIEKGHSERQIGSYLQHIEKSQTHNAAYEIIVQIGDRNTDVQEEKQVEVLKEYVSDFQDRNSHLYVFNASIHRDEESIHLHLDYIPFATGCKRGLEVQNGLEKALQQEGYRTKDKGHTAQMAWTQTERERLTDICREHDIQIEHKHENREHLTKENYILLDQNRRLEKEIEDKTERLDSTRTALESIDKDLNKSREELARAKEKPFREPEVKRVFGKEYYLKEDVQTYLQQMKARDMERETEVSKANRERDTYREALTTAANERDRARARLEHLQEKQWDKEYIKEQAKEIARAEREHEDFLRSHQHQREHDRDFSR